MLEVTPLTYPISTLFTFPMLVDSGRVTVPVNVGDSSGALVARLFVTVAAKFSSFPRAAASSLRVLSESGEAFVSTPIAAST